MPRSKSHLQLPLCRSGAGVAERNSLECRPRDPAGNAQPRSTGVGECNSASFAACS
jgi:hypothetical protein